MNGCPITWRSDGQKSISLSRTEAEYRAISEIATEILFLIAEMEFLGFEAKLPIVVNVDNLRAIYLSKTTTTCIQTKHTDTHYHFV